VPLLVLLHQLHVLPQAHSPLCPPRLVLQLNEALSDNPADTLDYSMRQELGQILRTGTRIADCMARCSAFELVWFAPTSHDCVRWAWQGCVRCNNHD
jgi:hypothetical protein